MVRAPPYWDDDEVFEVQKTFERTHDQNRVPNKYLETNNGEVLQKLLVMLPCLLCECTYVASPMFWS